VKLSNLKVPLDFLKNVLPSIRDYVGNYIALADTKAGVLIGVYSALLSFGVLKKISLFKISLNQWSISEYLTLGSWLLLLLALLFAVLVVWPKTSTSKKQGFVSWPNISNHSTVDDYLKGILLVGENELLSQLCVLNYDLSIICKRKYSFLSLAFKVGVVGVALLLILLIKKSL